jgi:septum formation protein
MIYLASQSPRRRELLEQIQVKYQSIAVTVDETPQPHETPQNYVSRLAYAKAQAGHLVIKGAFPVLGADTTIVCDGQLFGKPRDENHAKQMLRKFSGRSHQVITAIALVTDSKKKVKINTNNVYFRLLTDADIQAYIATGESLDKAGGYAIQGRASIFIERIEGSYSGVMGLPLYETATLFAEFGMKIL